MLTLSREKFGGFPTHFNAISQHESGDYRNWKSMLVSICTALATHQITPLTDMMCLDGCTVVGGPQAGTDSDTRMRIVVFRFQSY